MDTRLSSSTGSCFLRDAPVTWPRFIHATVMGRGSFLRRYVMGPKKWSLGWWIDVIIVVGIIGVMVDQFLGDLVRVFW